MFKLHPIMKDVEKYEKFEDLKKSEISESQTSENTQDMAEQFIQLLRKNSSETETPQK